MDDENYLQTVMWAVLSFAGAAQAQQLGGFYNYNGGDSNPPNSGSGSSNGESGGSSGSTPASGPGTGGGFGSSFGGFAGGFDPDRAARLRAIHGILGAVTMVVLFPSGAIFVRIFPAPAAVWVHGLLQTLALCVLIAAVALGIRLVQDVRAGTGMDLLGNSEINSHFIIGLAVMVCLIIQPIFGFIHHEKFKRLRRRTSASYVHLFNGRIFMTLGIVNGALGLWLAGASNKLKIAYIAAAATMWTLWLLTGIWAEWRIWKMTPRPWQRKKQESPLSWSHELGETSF